jgi:hypothetical protein
MDSQLEKYYLDKNNFTDEQIEEERDKKYRYYRGQLNDFRTLFDNKINDVEFEVKFEKLMDGYLNYRILNLVNSYRLLNKGFEQYKNGDGYEFSTEKYKDSLTHHDDDLESESDDEEQKH